jgi:hypothetical protein
MVNLITILGHLILLRTILGVLIVLKTGLQLSIYIYKIFNSYYTFKNRLSNSILSRTGLASTSHAFYTGSLKFKYFKERSKE